jgi:flagellar motility protein MotE (MotC chaperone)
MADNAMTAGEIPADEETKKRMKKDKGAAKEEDDEGLGSKILSFIIILAIIVIWLAIFGLLIKYDVGGFGSTVLRPVLKDVPVVNRILPEVSDETTAAENSYPYNNLSEAMERINELETELAAAKGTNTSNANYVAGLEKEIQRLKTFEQNQLAFEAEKDAFDRDVVFNDKAPDIEEYKKFYESIDPDNAAELYKEVIEQLQTTEQIKKQAEMFAAMKPANAAAIFNGMTGDLDLVTQILETMDSKKAALILAAMDTNMAEKVTKKMSLDANSILQQ